MSIVTFLGPYRFLSNFYPSPIRIGDFTYPTVEHAFQAQKTLDIVMQERIALANTPGRAKRLGYMAELRPDWDDIKRQVMYALVYTKFTTDAALREQLLATVYQELSEGNTWGDIYWGRVWNGREWVGNNHLGKILMAVRSRLLAAKEQS